MVTAPAAHTAGTMVTNNVAISKILVKNFIVPTSICKPIIMLYNKAAFTLTAMMKVLHAILVAIIHIISYGATRQPKAANRSNYCPESLFTL